MSHPLVAPPQVELLRPGEAARALGVDVKTIGAWARQGKLGGTIRTPSGHRRFPYQSIRQVAATLNIPWAVDR